MSNLKIHHGEWVVVCDGAKALMLENVGDAKSPNLKTREVFEQQAPGDPRAGHRRARPLVSSVGDGRSAVGQTDWHDQRGTDVPGQARQAARRRASAPARTKSHDRGRAAARARRAAPGLFARAASMRYAPRSTRTSSRCRCTRSRSI